MSQGFLLFAHNNEHINYGELAVWCARRLNHYYNRPVSLVCDSNTLQSIESIKSSHFDKIILSEVTTSQLKRYHDKLYSFNNLDRTDAFEITPYDETIIIDTDIAIQSSVMNCLWNSVHDFVVCADSLHVFSKKIEEFKYLSRYSSRFFWATQFYFRKTEQTKLFFDTCKYVKENYWWYAQLYDFDSNLVRNDYLWSIALDLMGGSANSSWCATMPWKLFYATDDEQLFDLTEDKIILGNTNTVRSKDKEVCVIRNKDVHLMNKNQLIYFVKKELGLNP